jgi:copper chaperone CopZ
MSAVPGVLSISVSLELKEATVVFDRYVQSNMSAVPGVLSISVSLGLKEATVVFDRYVQSPITEATDDIFLKAVSKLS